MTKGERIKLIQTAQGLGEARGWGMAEKLEYLIDLVEKTEREECAKVCEELAQYTLDAQNNELSSLENVMLRQISKLGHNKCAQAIRARGEAV